MTKTNIITVLGVLIGCGALVAAMGIWLGPEQRNSEKETTSEDSLIAPLTAKELAAYNVSMTNKKNPVAEVTTNLGTFKLELFEDTMPITAGNFIRLSEEGFYNGIKFHRIIDGFMIQGGDPFTKTEEYLRYGTGNPGYTIPDEHIVGKYLTNVRGTISMANSGPNSGGSQFFINVVDNTNLDFDKEPLNSKHPVFGRVLDGMEIVDKISKVEVKDRGVPVDDVVIESVRIIRS